MLFNKQHYCLIQSKGINREWATPLAASDALMVSFSLASSSEPSLCRSAGTIVYGSGVQQRQKLAEHHFVLKQAIPGQKLRNNQR